MGGCLGSHSKSNLVCSVNEPLKRENSWGRTAGKPRISEFWTNSTCDMDNSPVQSLGTIPPISAAVPSLGSISSISTPPQMHDSHGTCSSNNPSEFVNHGLLLWNQTRQHWVGSKKLEKKTNQLREPRISWNATYESLLSSNKPFRKPIPLAEMVDFLVDIWEQEGMYD